MSAKCMYARLSHSWAVIAFLAAASHLSAADLTGKWNFSWYTDNGVVDNVIELIQEGEQLKAKLDSTELLGAVDEDAFRLEGSYYAVEAGFEGLLKINGKQDGERLSGSATFADIPLTFSAVRAR